MLSEFNTLFLKYQEIIAEGHSCIIPHHLIRGICVLKIISYALGPVLTNSYLIADSETGESAIIDPAAEGSLLVNKAMENKWTIKAIWLTHAHFDHTGGVAEIVRLIKPSPMIALHLDDLPLWHAQGGAPFFGLQIDPGPEPTVNLIDGQILRVGKYKFEVRHTPGHTPGHVVFYNVDEEILFAGDVIFQSSIGRTDLPGGNYGQLMNSIQSHILNLPDNTRILPGHGPETSVGVERLHNPFLT